VNRCWSTRQLGGSWFAARAENLCHRWQSGPTGVCGR